jgi:hypothetical protein
MTIATAQTLDKEQVADLLGVDVQVVRRWTSAGIVPEEFYFSGDRREYRYYPIVIALGLLIEELAKKFGPKNKITFQIARQVAPKLETAWRAPEVPVRLRVKFADGDEMHFAKLDIIRRAREKLAAVAA